MTMKHLFLSAALSCSALSTFSTPTFAHDKTAPQAMGHAPIGVMADHRHKKGEWMLSYRYMGMNMKGNRQGKNAIAPDVIATTIPNTFFGTPQQPPTLRVVPTDMKMDMHMVGAMYGLSNRITLMAMGSITSKSMNHITYMGGMGRNARGGFNTKTSAIGDTTLSAIIALDDGSKPKRQLNINLGISLPTGATDKTGQILTPMGGTPSPRLPYPMQLGSGTFDFKPALTYFDRKGKFGWGAQASARIPLHKNSDDYRYGQKGEVTTWLAYEPRHWMSVSARLKATTQGAIHGQDIKIIAPVQTANPNFQGGETITALLGINLVGQTGTLRGQRLALEFGRPIYRYLNGVQLETDTTITLGWQKAF